MGKKLYCSACRLFCTHICCFGNDLPFCIRQNFVVLNASILPFISKWMRKIDTIHWWLFWGIMFTNEWFGLVPKLNELIKSIQYKCMLHFYVILLTERKLSLSNVVRLLGHCTLVRQQFGHLQHWPTTPLLCMQRAGTLIFSFFHFHRPFLVDCWILSSPLPLGTIPQQSRHPTYSQQATRSSTISTSGRER